MEITVKVDKLWFYDKITPTQAEVAELADALGSGLSGLTLVRVQVPPSALVFLSGILVSQDAFYFNLFWHHTCIQVSVALHQRFPNDETLGSLEVAVVNSQI